MACHTAIKIYRSPLISDKNVNDKMSLFTTECFRDEADGRCRIPIMSTEKSPTKVQQDNRKRSSNTC